MPQQWVDPEVFLEHNGKTVYHAYKDGNFEDRLNYWYTTCPIEEVEHEFDVRELSNWDEKRSHEDLIREAIDRNLLTFPD